MVYKYYYRFEGNANDSSGSNNGTWGGSSAYTAGAPFGQATDMTATSQYITTGAVTGTASGQTYSMGCWINTTAVPGGQVRFISGYNGGSTNFSLSIGIRTTRGLVDRGDTSPAVTSTTAINDGKRHHIVGTRTSGGNKVLFIDGKQEASASAGSFEQVSALGLLLNGYDTSTSQKFTHKQSENFFSDTVLIPAQIKNMYAYGKGFI